MEEKRPRSAGVIAAPLREYLQSHEYRRYSPNTHRTYGGALRDLDVFLAESGMKQLSDVTEDDIVAYRLHLIGRGFQAASLQVYLRAAKRFFGYLEKRRKIFVNPASGIVLFEGARKLQSVPSEEEVARLLAAPHTSTDVGCRDRALLETAYATGARRAELRSMRLVDLDGANGTVRLSGKGGKERVVPLGRGAGRWVERYLAAPRARLLAGRRSDALWIARNGLPMGYSSFHTMLHRHSGAVGLQGRLTMHSLRRACATHMLRRGASPVEIQHLLGHASMRHLSAYLRLTIPELHEVHARSRLGK